MKILALTRYSNMGASSRIRFYQFYDQIESENINIYTYPFFDNDYIINLQVGKKNYIKIFLSYIKRISIVLRIKNFDLIWIEKEIFPYTPFLIEKLFFRKNKTIIVDYDDAVFHNFDNSFFLVKILLSKKYDYVMQNSNKVIVGNKYLFQRAIKNNKNSFILPSVINSNKYFNKISKTKKNKNKIVIGWVGSIVTSQYLYFLKDVIKDLNQKFNNLEFIAIGAPKKIKEIGIKTVVWSENTEVNEIKKFDIGIMPLADNDFERGKCGFKLIQYMACELPVVGSAVGANLEIIDHNINGFLIYKKNEWIEKLQKLILNKKLRNSFGKRGKDKILKSYSTLSIYPKLENLFQSKNFIKNNKNYNSYVKLNLSRKNFLPKVAVVIPCYNNENSIRFSVISILNQTYKNIELIVINDGSTDRSMENIIDLKNKFKFKIYNYNQNKGLVFRLNQMIDLTDAQFIARMDADDLSHPNRILNQMYEFQNNNNLDIVSTGCAVMTKKYEVVGIRDNFNQPTIKDFINQGGFIHASVIYKRNVLENNKYDKNYYLAEDREIFLRIYNNIKFIRVNKPLYFVTEYEKINYKKMKQGYISERKAIKKHINKYYKLLPAQYYILRNFIKILIFEIFYNLNFIDFLLYKKGGLYFGKYFTIQKEVDQILKKNN